MYFLITMIRMPFYTEGFELAYYFDILDSYLSSGYSFFDQGFLQFFLRLGIGRDVILAYEVMENESCQSLLGLLFGVSSCINPPLDFYGLDLSNNKFYLGNPQFSSLVVLSSNPIIASIYSLIYAFTAYIILFLTSFLKKIPGGSVFYMPLYLLLAMFISVGPILYAWYLTIFTILMVLFYVVVIGAAKNVKNDYI